MNFKTLRRVHSLWKRRKRYDKYEQMPDWLLVVLGAPSFLITAYYGYVLAQAVPDYLRIANSLSLTAWGWQGWLLSLGLSWMAMAVWHFGSIAWKCNEVLRGRWYA